MIISNFPVRQIYDIVDLSDFSYTGSSVITGNTQETKWLRILSSGTLTVTEECHVDIFLVGAGGRGGNGWSGVTTPDMLPIYVGGNGGGAGYTTCHKGLRLLPGNYSVVIGSNTQGGDGGSTSFSGNGITITANGGKVGSGYQSAYGGSGGGSGQYTLYDENYHISEDYHFGTGGQNGNDGTGYTAYGPGVGQHRTTWAFEEPDTELFATGGNGGGKGGADGQSGAANTGNGGDGGSYKYAGDNHGNGGIGGSGIVIIRNAR
jgi:hypothetical protein